MLNLVGTASCPMVYGLISRVGASPAPPDLKFSYSKQGGWGVNGAWACRGRGGGAGRAPEKRRDDQLTPAAQTHICVTSSAWDLR